MTDKLPVKQTSVIVYDSDEDMNKILQDYLYPHKRITCSEVFVLIFSWLVILITFPISIFICIHVIREYERGVLFKFGKMKRTAIQPGIIFIVPCTDTLYVVDLRTVVYDVPVQEVLTSDAVTISIDAVVYYRVCQPQLAVISVYNYTESTQFMAATSLRNVIGGNPMSDFLLSREQMALTMQKILDIATDPWGVRVERVEFKNVMLPVNLQRKMAAEAEAIREARAKIVAAEGELNAAKSLCEASQVLASPAAIQLRYLQTMVSVSADENRTFIVPVPLDIINKFFPNKVKTNLSTPGKPMLIPPLIIPSKDCCPSRKVDVPNQKVVNDVPPTISSTFSQIIPTPIMVDISRKASNSSKSLTLETIPECLQPKYPIRYGLSPSKKDTNLEINAPETKVYRNIFNSIKKTIIYHTPEEQISSKYSNPSVNQNSYVTSNIDKAKINSSVPNLKKMVPSEDPKEQNSQTSLNLSMKRNCRVMFNSDKIIINENSPVIPKISRSIADLSKIIKPSLPKVDQTNYLISISQNSLLPTDITKMGITSYTTESFLQLSNNSIIDANSSVSEPPKPIFPNSAKIEVGLTNSNTSINRNSQELSNLIKTEMNQNIYNPTETATPTSSKKQEDPIMSNHSVKNSITNEDIRIIFESPKANIPEKSIESLNKSVSVQIDPSKATKSKIFCNPLKKNLCDRINNNSQITDNRELNPPKIDTSRLIYNCLNPVVPNKFAEHVKEAAPARNIESLRRADPESSKETTYTQRISYCLKKDGIHGEYSNFSQVIDTRDISPPKLASNTSILNSCKSTTSGFPKSISNINSVEEFQTIPETTRKNSNYTKENLSVSVFQASIATDTTTLNKKNLIRKFSKTSRKSSKLLANRKIHSSIIDVGNSKPTNPKTLKTSSNQNLTKLEVTNMICELKAKHSEKLAECLKESAKEAAESQATQIISISARENSFGKSNIALVTDNREMNTSNIESFETSYNISENENPDITNCASTFEQNISTTKNLIAQNSSQFAKNSEQFIISQNPTGSQKVTYSPVDIQNNILPSYAEVSTNDICCQISSKKSLFKK